MTLEELNTICVRNAKQANDYYKKCEEFENKAGALLNENTELVGEYVKEVAKYKAGDIVHIKIEKQGQYMTKQYNHHYTKKVAGVFRIEKVGYEFDYEHNQAVWHYVGKQKCGCTWSHKVYYFEENNIVK